VTLTVAGIAIADHMAIWRDYGGWTKTLDRYDLAPAGEPDLLTDDEVRRTRIVASRISEEERTRLVVRAATAPWHDVPAGSELAAGDSVTHWAAIRADLTDQRNSAELVACRTALLSSSATAAMATLPAVRFLDILAWDVASKR